MRRRTVLIPVLTLATLTTAFSWWLWRELPLEPVRSIVLPMAPIHGTLTVTKNDDYCLLNNFVMLGSFPAEVMQCIISLRTGEVILGPGGLERTAVELSKTHPWAYMRVGLDWDSADSNSPDRDFDCYALDLNTWDWRKVFWGSNELETNPFHWDVDYDYYGSGETKTKRWYVLIPEVDDRIWDLINRLVPSRLRFDETTYFVIDSRTGNLAGKIRFQEYVPAHPFVSETGLIWCADYGDSDDQCVIKAYDPRVRPIPYWLWAVTAVCVASVAVAARWGRRLKK